MEQKKREAISLLRLLAEGSTAKVRSLLDRYGAKSSGSYNELAESLSDLYKRTPDKVTLEKEIVSMHPHKDFILKYSLKEERPEAKEAIEDLQVMTRPETTMEVKSEAVKENKSNCSGCDGGCNGKISSAEGDSTSDILGHILSHQKSESRNRAIVNAGLLIAGTIGIIYFIKYNKA